MRPSNKVPEKYWTTSGPRGYRNLITKCQPGTLFTNKTLSENYSTILKEAESSGNTQRPHSAKIEARASLVARVVLAEAIASSVAPQKEKK